PRGDDGRDRPGRMAHRTAAVRRHPHRGGPAGLRPRAGRVRGDRFRARRGDSRETSGRPDRHQPGRDRRARGQARRARGPSDPGQRLGRILRTVERRRTEDRRPRILFHRRRSRSPRGPTASGAGRPCALRTRPRGRGSAEARGGSGTGQAPARTEEARRLRLPARRGPRCAHRLPRRHAAPQRHRRPPRCGVPVILPWGLALSLLLAASGLWHLKTMYRSSSPMLLAAVIIAVLSYVFGQPNWLPGADMIVTGTLRSVAWLLGPMLFAAVFAFINVRGGERTR